MKKHNTDLAALRRQYQQGTLRVADVNPCPFVQFTSWLDQAIAAGIIDANAMTLATADPDGRPAARMVLLKECTPAGFVFFTHYGSLKGRHLERNPQAALVFFWAALQRQVRVCGRVEKISPEESDEYFNSRPRASRISACISLQSTIIPSRAWLERKFTEFETAHAERVITRPEQWGGYRLVPDEIEFWQGRRDRLHDRIRYTRNHDGSWTIKRLAP